MARARATIACNCSDRSDVHARSLRSRTLRRAGGDREPRCSPTSTGAPLEAIVGIYLPERGYPTPKVDVRAGVFNERGDVLLVQEASDGRWALPGGWADEHDTPKRNCEREVLEESGYRVTAIKLVAIKDRSMHPYTPPRLERIYKLLFCVRSTAVRRRRASKRPPRISFRWTRCLSCRSVARWLQISRCCLRIGCNRGWPAISIEAVERRFQ